MPSGRVHRHSSTMGLRLVAAGAFEDDVMAQTQVELATEGGDTLPGRSSRSQELAVLSAPYRANEPND